MKAKAKISIAVIIIAAFIGGIFFATGTNIFEMSGTEAQNQMPQQDVEALPAMEINDTDDLSTAFNRVAETVTPGVVQIVTQRQRDARRRNPFEGTPFEDFFNVPEGQREMPPQTGLGSGVIVRSNGYIVTNYHVVEGADEVKVQLSDGTSRDGKLVGSDPTSDLALVRIDGENLPTIPFASSEDISVGNWVLAVGSPFDESLGNSVTSGIISATGRSGFRSLSPGDGRFAPVQDFIQTDAAINPGNSGGALVDLHGRLVGINSAIISRTGSFAGIGFAIPIDIVENAVQQIIDQGYVSRGYLGISYDGISPSLARSLDITRGAAQVLRVESGSPADAAGLQEGDIILSLDGQTLQNYNQLATIVAGHQPGEEIEITLIRDDEQRTMSVELGERPDTRPQAQRQTSDEEEPTEPGATTIEELGLEIANLTSRMRSQLQLPSEVQGVVITSVDPNSAAYSDAELRNPPYVLTSMGGESIESVANFQDVYGSIGAGEYFQIQVVQPSEQGPISFRTALQKPE
jgi:serine protease Do